LIVDNCENPHLAATYTKEAYTKYKKVIDAHNNGKKIQYKVSHRLGFTDYLTKEYPVNFVVKMGIQYRISPYEN